MRGPSRQSTIGWAAVLGSLLLYVPVVLAGTETAEPCRGRECLQAHAPVTLEQAVATAVAAIPGRAVEAQLSADEGRVVYEIEIIDRAQDRRRVYVDAEAGKVIKVRAAPVSQRR